MQEFLWFAAEDQRQSGALHFSPWTVPSARQPGCRAVCLTQYRYDARILVAGAANDGF
jgi:hypothetical protein